LSQNAQYCYSYVHNTNITVNILLFIIKQLTLCLIKMTRQEDQKQFLTLFGLIVHDISAFHCHENIED